EIHLHNPNAIRLESELLVPVPEGAVVRAFAFQGPASEPTAQLLPRDEARRAYEQIVAQARDPALLELAGYRMVRSSVFPVEPRSDQTVRLSYEHLLPIDGDRIEYVLPRSESVEYAVPWTISVEVASTSAIGAVYSPSHQVRTSRPKPSAARVELLPS